MPEGVGHLASHLSAPIVEHGYWGSARDRLPIAQVDALAGATLTSNGVNSLLHFWLGENGFGPFIANLRAGEA